ncbi:hypothetical protein EBAPG3_007080 [Nitrosospira lacus]|uniref:Uncharacterized protein n=1 Tax=Nitrosospira lacus TaxID=1288494 RepID=A0A1W6SP09_9PROT|nr:hypothetical protein [Nitrosospira lacus]ARO87550.1 hypothetical protein EBAPG3_007080 [Nitrosospira lacus]
MEKPKRFRQTSPHRLEIREDAGYLVPLLVSLPLLAAGLGFIVPGLSMLQLGSAAETPLGSALIFFIIGLFLSAGGLFLLVVVVKIFSRYEIFIDVSQGIVQQTWGLQLFAPIRRKDFGLGDYRAIALRYWSGTTENGEPTLGVLLLGNTGGDIFLYDLPDYSQARDEAMFLTWFLSLPLEDLTKDHKTNAESPCPWPGYPIDSDRRNKRG